MDHDNPALRLLNLLDKAKAINPNTASVNAWESLLDAKSDHALLLSRMGKMLALPQQIASVLSTSVEASPDSVRHIADQLYVAFTAHKFDGKWEAFTARIDVHIINYLTLASTLLETRNPTKRLDAEELASLREQLSSLLEKIRLSDIDVNLKSYIVMQLHDLIAVLDDYFITGAGPILERIEATVGHAYWDSGYRSFLTDHDLGQSLFQCLAAAANLITVAVGIPQLAHIVQLLSHGG